MDVEALIKKPRPVLESAHQESRWSRTDRTPFFIDKKLKKLKSRVRQLACCIESTERERLSIAEPG